MRPSNTSRRLPGWKVVTLSRRLPPGREAASHLGVDLMDAAGCRAAIAGCKGITHVLYAALYEKPSLLAGWTDAEQIEINRSMLRNLLDALEAASSDLQHITILQGTKAYGSHVRRVPVPAKERWPRLDHPIFYWQQEDLLRERQARAGWTFTVLRPQIVLGHAVGSPMNVIAAIGAYAAIQRELGRPLSLPRRGPLCQCLQRQPIDREGRGVRGDASRGGQRDLQRRQRRCAGVARHLAFDRRSPGNGSGRASTDAAGRGDAATRGRLGARGRADTDCSR